MDCYVIWDFRDNKDGAQQFLIDYIDSFHDGFAPASSTISPVSRTPCRT